MLWLEIAVYTKVDLPTEMPYGKYQVQAAYNSEDSRPLHCLYTQADEGETHQQIALQEYV